MSKIRVLLFGILLLGICFSGCKKSEEDVANEKRILGTWLNILYPNTPITDTITFTFTSDAKGISSNYGSQDAFNWEIKNDKLRTYYKKAPDYLVGYDQYNSKGMYHIKHIQDNEMKLIQSTYSGAENTLFFYKKP